MRIEALGTVLVAFSAAGCASGGGAAGHRSRALSFEEALVSESSSYEPTRGFRAVAEPEWARNPSPGPTTLLGATAWQLSPNCSLRFDAQADALAANEKPPFPTNRLVTDACRGHVGFWQQSGTRLFWWMGLSSGWSVEYYGEITSDTTMTTRRYALRADGARTWKVERATLFTSVAARVPEPKLASGPRKSSFDVTRAPRALGEGDWATRPGVGTARVIAGTRWSDGSGCVLVFGADILTRASRAQRLTRPLQSAGCAGLRGSWQQAGKRLFWRVNYDSASAGETYADVVADTLMRTRYYELRRAPAGGQWQATWVPTESRVLRKVRRP